MSGVLLDTHAFLWFAQGSARLSAAARQAVEAAPEHTSLSVASVWERAIKLSLGRLSVAVPLEQLLRTAFTDAGIGRCEIALDHVLAVRTLPWHHRDPFDRLLAAQCLSEGLSIISADPLFELYGVTRIW